MLQLRQHKSGHQERPAKEPGLRQVQDRIYDFIARIRRHLPGDVPYCVQHPEKC